MWVSTVRSDKNSRSAICRLVRSSAMNPGYFQLPGSDCGIRGGFNGGRRLASRLVFHGEGDTFLDRHRAAPDIRRVKRGAADASGDDRHRSLVLLAVQLDQGD